MLGRYQHQTLVTMGELSVDDVRGRSVGVRSWSQTTGVWLRGFLSEQYGIDLTDINWQTYEGGHVDGAADPAWVTRAPEGATLPADFLEGRLDYGIMGNELPSDDRIRTAIPNALAVASEWAARKGFAPINHVVGFSAAAANEDPKAVLAVYDDWSRPSRPTAHGGSGRSEPRRVRRSARARHRRFPLRIQQGLLPRRVEFDELVDRTCAALGVTASRLGGSTHRSF